MREDDLIDKIDRLQESIDLNNNLMIEFNDRLASIQESVSNKRGRMDAKEIINKNPNSLVMAILLFETIIPTPPNNATSKYA